MATTTAYELIETLREVDPNTCVEVQNYPNEGIDGATVLVGMMFSPALNIALDVLSYTTDLLELIPDYEAERRAELTKRVDALEAKCRELLDEQPPVLIWRDIETEGTNQ